MNKATVIVIFLLLFIFMLLDLIFKFPMIVRSVFYGGSFIIGAVIYYFNIFKPNTNESEDS